MDKETKLQKNKKKTDHSDLPDKLVENRAEKVKNIL